MKPGEVEKLLGGYSTGTLTPTEREALFTAALERQDLFDALADEEALRALLSDPVARTRLLAALGEKKKPFWARIPIFALAGGMAVVVLSVGVVRYAQRPEAKPVMMAKQTAPVETRDQAAPAPQTPAEPRTWKEAPARITPRVAATRPAPQSDRVRLEAPETEARPAAESSDVRAAPAPPAARSAQGVSPARPAEEAAPAPRLVAEAKKQEVDEKGAQPAPARHRQEAPGVGGGVVGGVIGGIISAPAGAAPPPPPPQPLQYVILGEVREGQAVQIQVMPQEDGFLRAVLEQPRTRPRVLFSGRVSKGGRYLVPPTGSIGAGSQRQVVLELHDQPVTNAVSGFAVSGARPGKPATSSAPRRQVTVNLSPR